MKVEFSIKVGTDIIEVERIQRAIQKYSQRFLRKIYTQREIDYCQKRAWPAQHFAGKFAAKEAVQKAIISMGPDIQVPFTQIEIRNDRAGRPFVSLGENLKKQCGNITLELSVSHIKAYATSTAIMVHK